MRFSIPITLLKERYLGAASRSEVFARKRLNELLLLMPPDVAEIVKEAFPLLIAYQDPDYALLYLERISRYVGPNKTACPYLAELASELDRRMRFDDVAALATRALTSETRRASEAFCLVDVVGMLPSNTADQAMPVLAYLGWSDRVIAWRFGCANNTGRQWTRTYAALKRVRVYSKRARTENAWVERWLHMVERISLRHPEAAVEVARSARLIAGAGKDYHRGMSRWHAIIDRLVKPAADGVLDLNDIAEAIRRAVKSAAEYSDSRQFDDLLVEMGAGRDGSRNQRALVRNLQ